MPLRRITKTLAFLLLLMILTLRSWPQAPLSSDAAIALLNKSLAATNLKAPGNQPFHLTATVKYKTDHPSVTGHFEIFFAAPNLYRINFSLGKITETQIASGDKLYISRSPNNFSAAFWRTAEFLWNPGAGLQTPQTIIVNGETNHPTVKIENNCEEESDALRVRKACFDPATQGLTSFTIQDIIGASLAQDTVSLSDFLSLGANRYPAHSIKKSKWDTIDATVDSFTPQTSFDQSTFTAPANSTQRDWCAAPQAVSQGTPAHRVLVGALYVYYVLVGTDGRTKKFAFVNDPINAALPQSRQALENKTYPVLACSGKPIEYELVVITNSF
jgi:hypothetical protein